MRHASALFQYAMYDESRATLLAEGSTKHACVDANGHPFPFPDWFKKLFS
jgi:acyl-CoA thioesterase FadM